MLNKYSDLMVCHTLNAIRLDLTITLITMFEKRNFQKENIENCSSEYKIHVVKRRNVITRCNSIYNCQCKMNYEVEKVHDKIMPSKRIRHEPRDVDGNSQ